jgi:hypothetical protein
MEAMHHMELPFIVFEGIAMKGLANAKFAEGDIAV